MTTNNERPDRDEDIIDRMLAGEPAASDAEAETRAPYERLVERLREFDGETMPAGWEDRAALRRRAARAREARAARRPWMIGGAVVIAAAAAVMLFVWSRDGASPAHKPDGSPQLAVNVVAPDGGPRRGDAAIGATIQVTVGDDHRTYVELRLYRGTTLVARCPGEPSCDGLQMSYLLSASGRYQVVLFDSDTPLPAAQGLDADLAAPAHVRVTHNEPIDVKP